VYKILASDGATAIANLPNCPSGNLRPIKFHDFPASVDLYNALLSPPEEKDQAVLLNSHIEA
jgi:hypothetical protein